MNFLVSHDAFRKHASDRHRNCLLNVQRRIRIWTVIAIEPPAKPSPEWTIASCDCPPPRLTKALNMAAPPEWILKLANGVAACLEPLELMPPLGCHYHQCEAGWEISIFPSQTEIVGGPQDGRQVAARFRVDIRAVTALFVQINELTWQSKSVNEEDQLGSHLAIDGLFEEEAVSVRVLKTAPTCFDPGRKVFFNHGCLIETW